MGLNEEQCLDGNIPIKVVKLDYSCIARAIAMRKTQGFFKIIVTNDDEMKILGMRAVGEYVIVKIEEKKTDSGILTKAANQGKVIDCQVDRNLRGKTVLFNDKREYTSHNNVLFIPYEFILAVLG